MRKVVQLRRPSRWWWYALALLGCLTTTRPVAQTQRSWLELAPAPPDVAASELCGVEGVYPESLGWAPRAEIGDGQTLMFEQTPAIISPDLTGSFSIAVQLVGDFETMQFERRFPDAEATTETWTRTGTRTVSGRIVSLFEKMFSDEELARVLRGPRWGFDNGGLLWGSVVLPGSTAKRPLRLRIGSTNLPAAAPLVQLSPDVQYAGSVVNIRIPDFGDERVTQGDRRFDLKAAAKKFYEFFPDSYEMIAFIPQSAALAEFGVALHVNVKNQVTGIGLRTFDDSSEYGSDGTLQGVELYTQTAFTTHGTSNHQIMHQWGNYLDLPGLAGVTAKGHRPDLHTPLTLGGTLVGAVLDETRRVVRAEGSTFQIQSNAFPIVQHPLEMYAMGKISADALGTQVIFQDQGQFDSTNTATPEVGTRLKGGVKEVTVGAILGKHGTRRGPSPTVLRRATVLVSRDALATQAEMDYWNFYAQRLADPNRTGVPSYDGNVSFDRSVQNTVDLQTNVVPKTGGEPGTPVDVTTPRFGRTDWRGVEFDDTVPSRFVAGQRVTLSGKVIATDRSDFTQVIVRFSKYEENASDAVRFRGTVTRSGTFTVDVDFTPAQRGLYSMGVFLMWPDSGAQRTRGEMTPVLVE